MTFYDIAVNDESGERDSEKKKTEKRLESTLLHVPHACAILITDFFKWKMIRNLQFVRANYIPVMVYRKEKTVM